MFKLKLIDLLVVGILVVGCIFASVDSDILPGTGQQHDSFFKNLTDAEKRVLMSLAISHYAPEDSDAAILPEYPIKVKTEDIPRALFFKMMNGNVPNKWMKEFIKWLKRDYAMTDASFRLYTTDTEERLCWGNTTASCIPMKTFQTHCCPFG